MKNHVLTSQAMGRINMRPFLRRYKAQHVQAYFFISTIIDFSIFEC